MKTSLCLWAVLALIVISACTGSGVSTASFGEPVYTPASASGFIVEADSSTGSCLITTTRPWQNADSAAVRRLAVLAPGSSAPAGLQAVSAPVRRVVTMSTTHIGLLKAIGADSVIVGVSGLNYVSDDDVRGRLSSTADVGYEGNIDYERLLTLRPDLVLLYGVNGPSAMEDKLAELGIPYMYVGDYTENDPLGKAEWMVALGYLLGDGPRSAGVFEAVAHRYDSIRESAACAGHNPTVMLNMPYNDSWFMPSTGSYVARLIADAGGRFIYTANTSAGSVPVDMETAYMLADSADFWLNTGAAATMAELRQAVPRFMGVPAVGAGHVYNSVKRMNARGANDYFESGSAAPDRVLADLVAILHPELTSDTLYYYKQLE